MQSLNPTRIVERRGRDVVIIGALLLLVGLVLGGIGFFIGLLFSSGLITLIGLGIGVIIVLVGFGFMIRGQTYRIENNLAVMVSEVLARELDASYTFIRNINRRPLGYIDAVLVGPPGALVFRITDQSGIFLNEGADWLERKAGQTFTLTRLNVTRECLTDVYALRDYLAKRGLSNVPVFAIVVFVSGNVQLSARQPVAPIAELRTLMTVLRRDFLAEDRIDPQTVEAAVNTIYT